MNPRRDQAKEVLDRGISRGELQPDLNAEILFDQLYGAHAVALLTTEQSADLTWPRRVPRRAID
jgi:hypothetical protein